MLCAICNATKSYGINVCVTCTQHPTCHQHQCTPTLSIRIFYIILYDSKHMKHTMTHSPSLSHTLVLDGRVGGDGGSSHSSGCGCMAWRPNIQTNLIYISVCLSEHSLMSVSEQTRQRRRCAMCTRIDTRTQIHICMLHVNSSNGAR